MKTGRIVSKPGLVAVRPFIAAFKMLTKTQRFIGHFSVFGLYLFGIVNNIKEEFARTSSLDGAISTQATLIAGFILVVIMSLQDLRKKGPDKISAIHDQMETKQEAKARYDDLKQETKAIRDDLKQEAESKHNDVLKKLDNLSSLLDTNNANKIQSPLDLLKIRFVNDEITKEQYEEKRAIILG